MALPCLLSYWAAQPLLGRERAFSAASESISRMPGTRGVYARQAFYRRTLRHVGKDVYFGFLSVFSKPDAVVGDGVYIGRFCCLGRVELGDEAMLADGVQVLSGRHQHGSVSEAGQPLRSNAQQFDTVRVGRGAWLGTSAVVMADVGERAVIGAGGVVVKPVPADQTAVGVPAKPIERGGQDEIRRAA